MKKAIFLDRDGVINEKRNDYVKSVEELEIFPFSSSAIKKINDAGFLAIIITNQSAINRSLMTKNDLETIHRYIEKHLNANSAHIDAFYFCPHRPDENCNCRKPKPGLIKLAEKDFQIDLSSSWIIGDSISDIEAGKQVNCKTIRIGKELNLINAIEQILKHE